MRRSLKVSELCAYLERSIITDPILQNLRVEGQIVNVSKSRYLYFDLKDDQGLVHCVNFDQTFDRSNVVDGAKVTIEGKLILYKAGGRWQIRVTNVYPLGLSKELIDLYLLKKRLEEEGLFDIDKKKELKAYPNKIAFLSSKDGAVIHDFCNEMNKRWPLAEILFISVPVQGVYASEKIKEALIELDAMKVDDLDLIVIARGGGSDSDLSAFNDEELVRTIANSRVPILTAIGHQVDNSLCDLAADARASTPTEAAILASSDINQLKMEIDQSFKHIESLLDRRIDFFRIRINSLIKEIDKEHPLFKISQKREKLKNIKAEISREISSLIYFKRMEIRKYLNITEGNFERLIFNINKKTQFASEWQVYDGENKIIADEGSLEIGSSYELKGIAYTYKIKIEGKRKND